MTGGSAQPYKATCGRQRSPRPPCKGNAGGVARAGCRVQLHTCNCGPKQRRWRQLADDRIRDEQRGHIARITATSFLHWSIVPMGVLEYRCQGSTRPESPTGLLTNHVDA